MNKYALVIGVGEYESSNLDNLSKVVTGAEELAKVLATYGNYKVVERLPKKWNQETKSWEIANKEVTKDEVIKALKTLLWERGNKSEVLIYFAGHGIRVKDDLDEFQGFLAVSDCQIQSKDRNGNVVKQQNAIALDIINRLIANEKCQVSSLVMLLDCCHSGSLLENQQVGENLTVFKSETNYYLMSACRDFEQARAFKGEKNSIFTGALLKGLSPKNANSNGEVNCFLVSNVIDNELKDSGQEAIVMGLGGSITLVQYSPAEIQQASTFEKENSIQALTWIARKWRNQFHNFKPVERYKEIQKIVNCLINRQEPNIIVLWGLGGCGKTALALLTCIKQEVRQYFTGGIFWVDLGEGKNVVEDMRNLYRQLTDSNCPYQDLDDIAYELTRELEKKDQPFLIVLDDVKEIGEINKFYEIPGKNFVHCTWLLTTEKHSILSEYDTRYIPIGLLRPEESTLILEYDLSQKGEFDEEKLRELVALLYEWPLLLNLVRDKINGLMENHTPNQALDNVIKRLKSKGWIKLFDKEISENLRISFDCLTKDEKELFEELLIFPENKPIPLSILEKLWELEDIDVEDLCQNLYNLSLLKKFEADDISAIQHIRLNSYLRHYLRQKNEIKEKLPIINNKLLEAYENKYQIKLTENLQEEFLNLLSNEEEKTYFKRFYKYHRKRAKLIQES